MNGRNKIKFLQMINDKSVIADFYKYGIIKNDNTIVLFNETEHRATVSTSDFLQDVEVELSDDGLLSIKAKRIVYDFYYTDKSIFMRVFEDCWEHEPHPKLIKTGKRYFWSKKKERYVDVGWVRTTETENVTYIVSLNNYKIEIFD